jgi:hypothetical protein
MDLRKKKMLFLPLDEKLNFAQTLLALLLCIDSYLSIKGHTKNF